MTIRPVFPGWNSITAETEKPDDRKVFHRSTLLWTKTRQSHSFHLLFAILMEYCLIVQFLPCRHGLRSGLGPLRGRRLRFPSLESIDMRYTIEQASDLGGVIRAARKVQNLRQDDAAGSVGVSESFMVKAERGADTVQWGKVFQILQGLGVRIVVDIPDASDELLKSQSARASHRASVRTWRAAERLLLRADAAQAPSGHAADRSTTTPPDAARVLQAARLLLTDAKAADAAESATRAEAADAARAAPGAGKPVVSPRALDIARRVLADAQAEAAQSAHGAGKETPHD